jgi:hypothetical protein
MTAVTTKTDPLALVERVQTLLAQTDAPLAKLEQGLLEIERVMASNDADLEEIASRRKIEMTAATPASELDKKLDALDKRKKEIERRTEIASIVRVELETRIATEREVGRAAKRQAAYDGALELHVTATNLVREFLDRFGPESRKMMRVYAECESKTAAANLDLPPGALPIPSIEAERRGELRARETTVREFKAFVDGRRFVAEQNYVQAAERKDGKWDVWEQGGTTGGGYYSVCSLEDYVEASWAMDATPWPDFLATSLSVPAFFVTQHPGWRPIADDLGGPVFPDQIVSELEKIEALPPPKFSPRVDQRIMSLANWRRMNGEGEVEPAPVAVAAE